MKDPEGTQHGPVSPNAAAPSQPGRSWGSQIVCQILVALTIAVALTAVAGWSSVAVSTRYHKQAAYHYDSAAYRMGAVRYHGIYQAEGPWRTAYSLLRQKDCLDLTLRVLLAPWSLTMIYGHMVVLLPFLCCYLILVLWYVHRKVGSWLSGCVVASFIFAFPIIWNPYQLGIADYWKDTLATWLLGSAALCWLLSEHLTRKRWAVLASLFLGLLVMQRTVAAVYAAALFLPVFLAFAVIRFRNDPLRQALLRIGAFVLPAASFGILVAIFQGELLYRYYFVTGYDYADRWAIARLLLQNVPHALGYGLGGVGLACFLCLVISGGWRHLHWGVAIALWFVGALPLAVIASKAAYFGFGTLWVVLLVALLATLIPNFRTLQKKRIFALGLLLISATMAVGQYAWTKDQMKGLIANMGPWQATYRELNGILCKDSPPAPYALVFDDAHAPLMNQAYADRKVLPPPCLRFTVHDSYYKASFGPDASPETIISTFVRELEARPHALVVGYEHPTDVCHNPNFVPGANPLAAQVARGLNEYLHDNDHWKVLRRVKSRYGMLAVYQHVDAPLTPEEKWADLNFDPAVLEEIPMVLALGPDFRQCGYSARLAPTLLDGVQAQSLPSGPAGLTVGVLAPRKQTVALAARIKPAAEGGDSPRTLVVTSGADQSEVEIRDEEDVQVRLTLHPGMNEVTLSVKETPDAGSGGVEHKEPMLVLLAPRLISTPD